MKITKHRIFYSSIGFIGGIILTVAGYGIAETATSSATSTATSNTSNSTGNKTLPLSEIKRFTNAISEIKSYYIKPVSDQQLFEYAIKGMVENLDPHSDYLNKTDFADLTSMTSGEFGGLGLEITQENGILKVITPIDDTPAYYAGIKPGDLIISLDNTPTDGMSLKEAVEKMRGKKGTLVTLVVLRKNVKNPITFNIVRDVIHVKSVTAKMLEGGYGYIRLNEFQADSPAEMSDAINQLQAQANGHLTGLVLDLRNNPGGLLDSAVAISDMLLDSNDMGKNKIIVYTKGRVPDSDMVENATPGDLLNGAPIVVLINEGTASAAEILAGALQDHHRAILVGSKTFGKGSVQTVLPLDISTGIKITTALYYTPDGRSIQALGIVPNIQVADVKIEKPTNDNKSLNYSEANLTGHLVNGQDIKSDNNPNTLDDKTLIYNDFALYQALTVLKGMVVQEQGK